LEVDQGGIVDISDKSPRVGEAEVIFRGPGTVTLTAYNAAGSTTMTIPSPVDPVPVIEEFFAAPSRAGTADPVDIHWKTWAGHRVILELDGVAENVVPTTVTGTHRTGPITGPTSFVLRVFNSLGHEVVSDPLLVDAGAPNALRFDTANRLRLFRVGSKVQLVWENDGGTQLTVTNTLKNEVVCTTNDWNEIRRGGCEITMPPEQQDVPLRLDVTNNLGTDSRTLELQAVRGPIILSFTTEREEITEGDSLLFLWEAQADAEGNIPELMLVDELGNTYDMSDVLGQQVLQGSKRFRVQGWGEQPRTFTLTATTPVPPPYSITTDVMVYGIPVVEEMRASPPFALQEGDVVHVTVRTKHGVKLELFHLAENGTFDA